MSWIFTGMLLLSILFAILNGNADALGAAISQGAQAGITLAITIAGPICLWSGVARLMEQTGVTALLARILRPLLNWLFPSSRTDPQLSGCLTGNICANLLGLGNAATPLGIQAVKHMVDPRHPDRANDEICRLIVLNTASIQLIPTNVAAIRSSLGSAAPFDILPAVWTTSLCAASVGLFAAYLLGKAMRHD